MTGEEFKALLKKMHKIFSGMEGDSADYMDDFFSFLDNLQKERPPGINRNAGLEAHSKYTELLEQIEDFEESDLKKSELLRIAKNYFKTMATDNPDNSVYNALNQTFNKDLYALAARNTGAVQQKTRYNRNYKPVLEQKNGKRWLENMLERLTMDKTVGQYTVELKGQDYVVTINGNLPIQYAANRFFRSMGVVAPAITDTNISTASFTIDKKTLTKYMKEHRVVELAAAWLKAEGFDTRTGGKFADELFVNCEGIDGAQNA